MPSIDPRKFIEQIKKEQAQREAEKLKVVEQQVETVVDPVADPVAEQTVEIKEPEIVFEEKEDPLPKKVVTPKVAKPKITIPKPKPELKQAIPNTANKPSWLTNIQGLVKDIKNNSNPFELNEGFYQGIIDQVELTTSKQKKKMLKYTMTVTHYQGLEHKNIAFKYSMLEHENPKVVNITLRQLKNMLDTLGYEFPEVPTEDFFNALTPILSKQIIYFEVKGGFVNFKEFNGKKI